MSSRILSMWKKNPLMRYGAIALVVLIGSFMALNFMNTGQLFYVPSEAEQGTEPTLVGTPPTITINSLTISGSILNIDITITEKETEIRSYYVSLYIEGRFAMFLFEKDVSGGPYGATVNAITSIDLKDFDINTPLSESKTIRVEATDTVDTRYAKTEEAVTFQLAYPDAPATLGILEWNSWNYNYLTIQWSAPTDKSVVVKHYNIYRSADGGLSFVLLRSSNPVPLIYKDPIIPGNSYVYKVAAVGVSGEGGSKALNVNTLVYTDPNDTKEGNAEEAKDDSDIPAFELPVILVSLITINRLYKRKKTRNKKYCD